MRVLAALLAVAISFAVGPVPAEAKKVLRFTLQLPLKSVVGHNVLQFKDEVEKATAGAIEIQVFDSAQLFDDKDVPNAVGSGQIDIGVASLARFVGEVPAVDVFHIPFLFDSDAKLRLAVAPSSPVRGPLDAAIGRTGARVLWWQAYGGTVLLTKGGEPIRTPVDLKGRKVRVISKLLGAWVTANGGLPVNVSGGEQYFSYQRGTVDIGMTGPDSIKSRKLWEVMDTVTIANVANVEFVVVINEKLFQSLTDDEKSIVTKAAVAAEAKLRNAFAQLEKEALEAGRQNKMTIYVPSATEMAAFRQSVVAVRDVFLKDAGALGQQVYDAALALK